MIRSTQGPSTSKAERRWLKVFHSLNEFQARLFAADKALDWGRGGISYLSALPDVRGPGLMNLDLSIFKNFRLSEKDALVQFRAEAFNLTNTPQFGMPATTFGAGNFGVISGQANAPRQIQLGLRLQF